LENGKTQLFNSGENRLNTLENGKTQLFNSGGW